MPIDYFTCSLQTSFLLYKYRFEGVNFTWRNFRDAYELLMRKSAFCICEKKVQISCAATGAADQRLCFCYIDGTISLFPKSEISRI